MRARSEPQVSTSPPPYGEVVAPERNVRTGRFERGQRSDKDRQTQDRPPARRAGLRSAKVLVPVAAVAGLLIAGAAVLAAQGGDDTEGTLVAAEPTIEASTDSAVSTTAVTSTIPAPVCTTSDASGLTQITTAGDSITRLDAASAATCVGDGELALTGGRSWSRTRAEPLTIALTDRSIEIRPDSAVAVDCAAAARCSVLVLQGSAALGPVALDAPRSIVLDADPTIEMASQTLVPFDGAFGDPWLVENAALDTAAGLPDLAEIFVDHGPAFASLAGVFTGQRTVLAAECTDGPCDVGAPVGDVADRTYTFAIDCAASPCVGQAVIQFAVAGATQTATVPMTFDGAAYRWVVQAPSYQCAFDDDRDGTLETQLGELQLTIDYTLTPQAAEVRDGRYIVSAITVLAESTNTVTNPHPRCAAFGSSRNASEFTATR